MTIDRGSHVFTSDEASYRTAAQEVKRDDALAQIEL